MIGIKIVFIDELDIFVKTSDFRLVTGKVVKTGPRGAGGGHISAPKRRVRRRAQLDVLRDGLARWDRRQCGMRRRPGDHWYAQVHGHGSGSRRGRWDRNKHRLHDLCGPGLGFWRDATAHGEGSSASGIMGVGELVVRHCKRLGRPYLRPQLVERGPLKGVQGKESFQHLVGHSRDGQDGAQKVGILFERAEGLVRLARLFPGVAAAGEIDKYDAERPQVVVRGRVAGGVRASAALAFGREVKGGSAKTSGHVL